MPGSAKLRRPQAWSVHFHSPLSLYTPSPRNTGEHLRVRREFLHEEEQSLDGLDRLVPGETAADDVDLVQVSLRKQKLLPTRAALEDIDGRVDAQVADLAIEDELHVAGALELEKDELIHTAAGLNERGGDNGKRTRFLGVTCGGENLAW